MFCQVRWHEVRWRQCTPSSPSFHWCPSCCSPVLHVLILTVVYQVNELTLFLHVKMSVISILHPIGPSIVVPLSSSTSVILTSFNRIWGGCRVFCNGHCGRLRTQAFKVLHPDYKIPLLPSSYSSSNKQVMVLASSRILSDLLTSVANHHFLENSKMFLFSSDKSTLTTSESHFHKYKCAAAIWIRTFKISKF